MLKRPLPTKEARRVLRLTSLAGIDRREGAPFGSVTHALGAMCTDGVTFHGGPTWERIYTFPDTLYPQSVCAVGGGLFAMCRQTTKNGDEYIQDGNLRMVAYMEDGSVYQSMAIYDREDDEELPLISDINMPRSMVQFNVYSQDGQLSDAVGGTYDKKLLVFPDKMAVDLPVTGDGFVISKMEELRGDVPDLLYVTVQGGRLFGVDEGRIYASAYNDPWDWDVDTAEDIGAENAWVTATGADTRGDGAFTGIVAYNGDVWGMKEDFGHIVSGQSNPFTVKDTDAIGALSARAVVRADGRLFFVRHDGVRMAEGSTVSLISDPLCLGEYTCGICTYYDGVFYMAEGGTLYTYHVKTDSWSALSLPDDGEIVSLAAGREGIYAMTRVHMWENYIYRLSGAPDTWELELCPTDFDRDTDKRPATLTLHALASEGAEIALSLRECNSGKELDLGSRVGDGGGLRFRTHIRGGAGHRFAIRITVKGEAVIRGVSISAGSGVTDDG